MSTKIKTLISGRGLLWLLVLVCLVVSVPSASCTPDHLAAPDTKSTNVSTLDRLQMNLFVNYDANVQPTIQGKATNVSLGLSVNYIDIDELNGKITLHCWLTVRWVDEQRSWNIKQYDNITKLHIPDNKVWKPQIMIFNAAADEGNYPVSTQMILSNDGSFLWVPPAVYTAYCALNMINWPYDQQICKLKIGTWSVGNLNAAYNKVIDYDDLVQSSEWEIVSGRTESVHKDYYSYVEFIFTTQRRSSMYKAIIFTPASCIVILTLAAFWLPPKMGEKIMVNGILILLIASFLMYFAQLLPVLGGNTPLIVVFYSASLLVLSISTIIEVVVLYLATAQHKRRVPDIVKRLLNGKLGSCLMLSHFTNDAELPTTQNNGLPKEMDENLYNSVDDMTSPLDINPTDTPSARALQFDWVLLATAVDRICFIAFSLVFIVLSIVYIA
ncbi:hypothetical protein AWZ03_003672 [Drosophila navojoa]|uniref:Neurotransmitter-gated ion-channel ligand-binding domain-containing protein n=1 Tax=Drosophila navojoa TaxID=7232 RepID=A0A484BM07_DRONA|nr:acetylcholine receptor subunit beta-type lev-1 [Drosophila navojoa]TDG49896.1 hypothetical protein AWZ03_003672 [Drosophila navojoa]